MGDENTDSAAPTICSKCGTQNKVGARFCRSCGASLAGLPESTPTHVPQVDSQPQQLSAHGSAYPTRTETQPPDATSANSPPAGGFNPIVLVLLAFLVVIGTVVGYVIWQRRVPANPQQAAPAQISAKPSFDCTKARTPTEKLICSDGDLALLERSMVSAYNQAMGKRSMEQRKTLRREHVQWFKEYARTCDAAGSENERKECVTRYLTNRTSELTALSH
jgi:hypothetical protein